MRQDHEKVVKIMNRIAQLGVKVSKTKSRIEILKTLKPYQESLQYVKP